MKITSNKWVLFMVMIFSIFTQLQLDAQEAIEGKWDLTVNMGEGRMAPSWLEVRHTGVNGFNGRFVSDGGSARPISKIDFNNNKLAFHIPAQWQKTDKELIVEGVLENGQLKGTMTYPSGATFTWVAVRAPKLWRAKEPVWDKPVKLFNGKNLEGWEPMGNNQWVVEDGVLKSPKSGSNIRSTKTFDDFKLHIEFRYPKGSNSGVYLRGRYEIQIEDTKGLDPMSLYLGGIYGFIDPWLNMAKDAGEWQSYDVTLVGRMVTLVVNGQTVIYKQEIPGITGGAIDSKEGEPGPIMMQGDHGPIEFRNIIITTPKS